MAEQAEYRVYKRKRITNPADESMYVDIPVMYEARFKLMQDQAQEFYIYFDNSENSSRKTHVKRVTSNHDSLQYIDVERIDEWPVKTMQEQAQEATFVLTNNDPPPIQSDGSNNPAHEQVHYVRYYKDNNPSNGIWVDVELIDQLKITCMQEQAQEYVWFIKHPTLGASVGDPTVPYQPLTVGYCDPSLELAD